MNHALWILGAAATACVLGVAAELGVRLWLRRWGEYYVWPPGLRLHLHPDRKVFPELEPHARIEINADGERGDSVPRTGERLYRILVAGGSPVECALLDQPTSWPGALERLLKATEHLRTLGASNVHVGNIGRSGVRSQTLNLILSRILPRYRRLNLIVIMIGGNDIFYWLANGAPESVASGPVAVSDEVFSFHPEGPFGWEPRGLAMVHVLQGFRRRWLRPVKVREGSGGWVRHARTMRARAKEIRTTVPDPGPMLNLFEEQFRQLLGRAKAHADRVLVVRQPWFEKDYTAEELAHLWHGAVGNPEYEDVSIYYSIDVVCQLMTLLDARAVKVAEDLMVEHLNVMPLLEPSLKTYYDFIHFTPAGSATVAEAVAAAILQQPIPAEETGSPVPVSAGSPTK